MAPRPESPGHVMSIANLINDFDIDQSRATPASTSGNVSTEYCQKYPYSDSEDGEDSDVDTPSSSESGDPEPAGRREDWDIEEETAVMFLKVVLQMNWKRIVSNYYPRLFPCGEDRRTNHLNVEGGTGEPESRQYRVRNLSGQQCKYYRLLDDEAWGRVGKKRRGETLNEKRRRVELSAQIVLPIVKNKLQNPEVITPEFAWMLDHMGRRHGCPLLPDGWFSS